MTGPTMHKKRLVASCSCTVGKYIEKRPFLRVQTKCGISAGGRLLYLYLSSDLSSLRSAVVRKPQPHVRVYVRNTLGRTDPPRVPTPAWRSSIVWIGLFH